MNDEALLREARAIEHAAQHALGTSDLALPPGFRTGTALPVRTLDGEVYGWFVPVVAQDRLVAFLRYTLRHVLQGTSSFCRQPGRADGCPLAGDWLDTARIRGRARALAGPDDEVGDAVLSFDGSPERLAWAVPLRRTGVAPRWVFVAGETAWNACNERPSSGRRDRSTRVLGSGGGTA